MVFHDSGCIIINNQNLFSIMETKIELIKNEIIRLIKLIENNEWESAEIIIQFPPFINKGFNTLPSFWNANKERVRLFLKYDDKFQTEFFAFIINMNENDEYNQIVFVTKKDDYDNATISISFNQAVENEFRNNLPKSWRKKKIVPWWKNPEETKRLGL
jgi:hypothetical protein